jgi:hypothetical protein
VARGYRRGRGKEIEEKVRICSMMALDSCVSLSVYVFVSREGRGEGWERGRQGGRKSR